MTAGLGRNVLRALALTSLMSLAPHALRAQDPAASAQRAAEAHIEPGDRVGV
jgi:hypothetical protein